MPLPPECSMVYVLHSTFWDLHHIHRPDLILLQYSLSRLVLSMHHPDGCIMVHILHYAFLRYVYIHQSDLCMLVHLPPLIDLGYTPVYFVHSGAYTSSGILDSGVYASSRYVYTAVYISVCWIKLHSVPQCVYLCIHSIIPLSVLRLCFSQENAYCCTL